MGWSGGKERRANAAGHPPNIPPSNECVIVQGIVLSFIPLRPRPIQPFIQTPRTMCLERAHTTIHVGVA